MSLLNDDNKEKAISELEDEIDVVLSIKDGVTRDEIDNFKEAFPMLTEEEIRKEISKLTQDQKYIEEYSEEVDDVKEYKIGDSKLIEKQEKADLEDTIRIDAIKIKTDIPEPDCDVKVKEVIEEDEVEFDGKEVELEEKEEYLETDKSPENIKVIRGEVKYNQLSIDWDWPYGVQRVLVLYRNDKFPAKPNDSGAVKIAVEKNYGETVGQFTIHKVREENYYFCVFPVIKVGDDVNYLEGKKRLIVCKEPSEVCYNLKVKKRLLGGIKAASIIFKTSAEEINLVPTILVAKKGNLPVFKSDGEEIYKFDYIKLSKDEFIEMEIPIDILKKNTYVKLFLEDERNSSLFRILPPEKKELYFK